MRRRIYGLSSGLLLTVLLIAACAQAPSRRSTLRIDEREALSLAVTLANERCQAEFSQAPFDSLSYAIEFRNGRWRWGRLDPPGDGGFSARVSFDARGANRDVEVCFNTDGHFPVDAPVSEPQR